MFYKSIVVAAIASMVAAAPTQTGAPAAKRSADSYGNKATWYNAETGNRGACGQYLSNDDRFVAVGFGSSIPCGQWMVGEKTNYSTPLTKNAGLQRQRRH